MRRLLLVEDEPGLVVTLVDRLRAEGYDVTVAPDGREGLRRGCEDAWDLVILDLLLPGMGGLEVCRELRRRGVETPILMLTALSDVVDRVVGLRVGGDDYLTKPFATAELLARLEALLRRPARSRPVGRVPDPFHFGPVEVRFREARVLRNGREVHLTPKMFDLLRVFIRRRGEALTRDELLDEAWGREESPAARTVDVHVGWLRQRLEENPRHPRHLQTVRGVGYRFVE